jgi:hypothetical protein
MGKTFPPRLPAKEKKRPPNREKRPASREKSSLWLVAATRPHE